MPHKIIYVDQIGDVTFKKNSRSRNVSIAIRPHKGVIVNFPRYVSYKFALSVVEKKRNWILEHLPKIKSIENNASIFDENTNFSTRNRKLVIHKNLSDKVEVKIYPNILEITYPPNIDIQNQKLQEIIKKSIIKTLRLEAKEYLPSRTQELAHKYKFKFKQVFVKNTKTIWGSCSAQNNINLNIHLLRLPDYLIDYVIIHELCHTVEKNHGKGFWTLMDSILGDAKKLSKELKSYSIQIY